MFHWNHTAMNKQAKNEQIIDYLTGELSKEDNEAFEKYLKNDPALAGEVKDLAKTRKLLSFVYDEEVIEPPIYQFLDQDKYNGRFPRVVWVVASIAASICLLMLVGYLTKFNAGYQDNRLQLGFGQSVQQQVTRADMEQLLTNFKSNTEKDWGMAFASMKNKVSHDFEASLSQQQNKIDKIAKSVNTMPDDRIEFFIKQISLENRKSINNFYETSTKQQEQYLRSLMLQFYDYLNQQREEDLRLVEANLLRLKSDNDEKQELTNQVLARIISTVNQQNSAGQ